MTQQELVEEYLSLPDEARRMVADFVVSLRQRLESASPADGGPPDSLESEPFVGMWWDRADMEDSAAWVRGIRKAEWGDGSDPH